MKSLKCWAIHKLLVAYADEALSASENNVIREHLKHCPECALAHENLRATNKLLFEVSGVVQKQEIFWRELEDEIMDALPKKKAVKPQFRWEFLEEFREDARREPAAAVLSIVLSVALGLVQGLTSPTQQISSTQYHLKSEFTAPYATPN